VITDMLNVDPDRLLAIGEHVLSQAQTVRRLSRVLATQVDATLRRSQALVVQSKIVPSERITNRHGVVAFEALRSTNLALALTNRMLEDASAALAGANEEMRNLGLEVYVLSEQLKTSEAQVRSLLSAPTGQLPAKPDELDEPTAAAAD
jgi:hypothetical protein